MEGIMAKRMPKAIQLAAVIIAIISYFGAKTVMPQKDAAEADKFYYVTRVVDGDTLQLSDGSRVRLIGIDTPELHYSKKLARDAKRTKRDVQTIQDLGRISADFTGKLCLDKKVRLEFDVEKHDRYGRMLAYVWLEDGTFVNARIVEEGYAQILSIPPNVKFAEYFLKLQKEASKKRKGLWGRTDTI